MNDALDRLAPVMPEFVPTWDEILARAGMPAEETARVGSRFRRSRWILALAVAAAILIPLAALAGSQDWWFFRFGGSPAPVGGVSVVKTGSWDGKDWKLTAYRSATDGICFAMTPSTAKSAAGTGAAMSCDLIEGVPRTSQSKRSTPDAITYLISFPANFPAYIVGPVVGQADEVVIYLADGTILRTPTFDAPQSLGAEIRFYAAQLPRSLHPRPLGLRFPALLRQVVGVDHQGRIVACLAPSASRHGVSSSACP